MVHRSLSIFPRWTKIERAQARRMELLNEGNALFVDEAYAAAANAYSRALQTFSKAEGTKNSSSAAVADVHAKRAAAHLKLRKLNDALTDADAAIQIDSTLEMAHLRKGYVRYGVMGNGVVWLYCLVLTV